MLSGLSACILILHGLIADVMFHIDHLPYIPRRHAPSIHLLLALLSAEENSTRALLTKSRARKTFIFNAAQFVAWSGDRSWLENETLVRMVVADD